MVFYIMYKFIVHLYQITLIVLVTHTKYINVYLLSCISSGGYIMIIRSFEDDIFIRIDDMINHVATSPNISGSVQDSLSCIFLQEKYQNLFFIDFFVTLFVRL